jgi:hypothetical protein
MILHGRLRWLRRVLEANVDFNATSEEPSGLPRANWLPIGGYRIGRSPLGKG